MDGGYEKILTGQEINTLVQLYSKVMQSNHFPAEKKPSCSTINFHTESEQN